MTIGYLILFLLTGGSLFLLIYLPLTSHVDVAPPMSLAFSAGLPNYKYQQRVCTPYHGWELATNERELSNAFFAQSSSVPDPRGLSSLVWAWGQFIDHDIVHSRTNASAAVFQLGHLNLTRVQTRNGEPMTFESPMIDASTVYGDYINPQNLRDGTSCKLRTSEGNLLPLKDDQFEAGDDRNTEHPLLNALHVLWMREHNRLCDVIPGLDEEQKFWKARQIVIAKIQRITYEEWLPALFGDQIGLLDTVQERGTGVRISAEFATVAYRFGHSMVSNKLGQFDLGSLFFNVPLIQAQGIEPFLVAAVEEPAQKVDTKVVDGLRNILFGVEDLITRNLFRARETGSPRYADLAACYGFYAYPHGHEDPLLGLLSEPLAQGSSLPIGIATIVAEQFKRLRKHDPYFYTHTLDPIGGYFDRKVSQTTIAEVIRKNTHLKTIQTKGFYV